MQKSSVKWTVAAWKFWLKVGLWFSQVDASIFMTEREEVKMESFTEYLMQIYCII